ncbi:cardiolipin synthase [Methylobacterium sp. J-077]|uniref:cardiolipin synthase n=1 Tax=Methylobacterium sp. J-077 TaxID=2836656 RepID=UPI001FBA550D|nr:cardiolipin synthase [Methylobacterium sp. J-077]MCJ2124964.1 cardiolipin synthase [Methylobacterium sp. J-077]
MTIEVTTAVWLTVGAIHLAVIARAMLLDGRDPYARAAWLILLVALPGVGILLYVLFGEPWISTGFRKRSGEAYEALLPFAQQAVSQVRDQKAEIPFRTCEAAARWPVSAGNTAEVAPSSDMAIDMIVADLDAARHSVHLSFYIWLSDRNGTKVAEAVCRAARRGVTCRIVADAVGSRWLIRSELWTSMRDAGARLCPSLPPALGLGFLTGHRADLRNHRKVIVVDGHVTWCGSQNCADPAFLPKHRFAPWVDILIRYEGPVARQAEIIFASAWTTETGEDLRGELAVDPPTSRPKGFPAIAVGTGPMSPHATMTDIFVSLLASARGWATITTPYFAPDLPLLDAIVAASRRGVDVTIVLPRRNDSRIVRAISRAYYPVLVRAGVHIHEYQAGLLHAKTVVVDDRFALVGSANMDRRSLDLNFENNILFESVELTQAVHEHQQRWLLDAIELDGEAITERTLPRRFVDNLLTMVSPLF